MRDLVNNDCYHCVNKRKVAGNAHISCADPDPHMTGDAYGKRQGWFIYPSLFDPIWMTSKCHNYKEMSK